MPVTQIQAYCWKRPAVAKHRPDVCNFVYVQLYGSETASYIAQQIVDEFNKKPQPQKILIINGFAVGNRPDSPGYANHPILSWHNDDRLATGLTTNGRHSVPWMENGIVSASTWCENLYIELKKRSFTLDGVIMDHEEQKMSMYLGTQMLDHFDLVRADSRWDSLVLWDNKTLKQIWEDAGSPLPVNGQTYTQPVNQPFMRWWFSTSFTARNWAMHKSIYTKTKQYFPNAFCGNYDDFTGSGFTDPWAAGAQWLYYTNVKSWADVQTRPCYPVHYTHPGSNDSDRMILHALDTFGKMSKLKDIWLWFPIVGSSYAVGTGDYTVTEQDVAAMHSALHEQYKAYDFKPIIFYSPSFHDSDTYFEPTFCSLDLGDVEPITWPNFSKCAATEQRNLKWIWHPITEDYNAYPSTYGINPNHPLFNGGWSAFAARVIADFNTYHPQNILVDFAFGVESDGLQKIDRRLDITAKTHPLYQLSRIDRIKKFIRDVYTATGKYPWFKLGGFNFSNTNEKNRWAALGAHKALWRIEKSLQPFLDMPVGLIVNQDTSAAAWPTPAWDLCMFLRTFSETVGYWGYPPVNTHWGVQHSTHLSHKRLGFFSSAPTLFPNEDTSLTEDCKDLTTLIDSPVVIVDSYGKHDPDDNGIKAYADEIYDTQQYSIALIDRVARQYINGGQS